MGEVLGTDSEICNNIAEYAKSKNIEYMEITEEEFKVLKRNYLSKHESKKSNKKSLKEENNRQKVTEGIIKYFNGVFPIIEKDDSFRFSMYTKNNVMIGVELFKDYIFVGLFNLDGKNNLDETIEIERFDDDNIANEILYDSDAIYEYLEEYKLV